MHTIRLARREDVRHLPAIERAAAQLLRDHVPASMLDESTSERDFIEALMDGRLWVALRDDVPVGFALVEMLAPALPHLEEIDVHPAHGRRGIGAALVQAVCEWTATHGYPELTLTTFRAVSWNMPFYAKLGFVEIPAEALSSELAEVIRDEAARGLDPARRVAMRYCPDRTL